MKIRRSNDGLHFFDRTSGVNLLLDEVEVPCELWSRAPRFVSFALTNACDLDCPFCYAPKKPAALLHDELAGWVQELDSNGCLGIGFGGGEPTLYPRFSSLCRQLSRSTTLSISFTTHGHRLTRQLANELRGSVHFVRISMDGVGTTYERIRGRPFDRFLEQLKIARDIAPFGINYVVNDATVNELDDALDFALEAGARELLLLPEHSEAKLSRSTLHALEHWVSQRAGGVRLAIAEGGVTAAIPVADPFVTDKGTKAYIHVNAFGAISRSSYQRDDAAAVRPGEGILSALARYERNCS